MLIRDASRLGHFLLREIELVLPEQERARLIIMRRKKLWREKRVIFIHVPKAAGTSISDAIYGRFMGHVAARHIHKYAPDEFKAFPNFAVVRNPYARVLSAYRFAKAGSGQGTGPVAGMFHSKGYQIPSFRTFETFVKEWLVAQDIAKADYVFRPQTHYTHSVQGAELPEFVGRVEDMDAVENYLQDRLGRKFDIGHHNHTAGDGDYNGFYTPGMRKIIQDIYSHDFNAFNYGL